MRNHNGNGTGAHDTPTVKDTTINLYDENGKPVNPVKGLK